MQLHLDTNISAPKMNQFPQKLQEWDCIWGRGRSHGFAFFLFLTILFFPPSSFSASTFPFFSFSLLPSGCSELYPVSLSLCQAGDTGDSCVTPPCHPPVSPPCPAQLPQDFPSPNFP